jgi:tol-pal system protein YbgF
MNPMKNIPDKMKKVLIISSAVIFSGMFFHACDFFKKKEDKKDSSENILKERLAVTEKKLDEILAAVNEIRQVLSEKETAEKKQQQNRKFASGNNVETENAGTIISEQIPETGQASSPDKVTDKTPERPGPEKKIQPEKPKESPDIIYKKALDSFRIKNFDRAAMLFDQIITFFPGNDLTDNALFWKGESLFALKKYSEAIESFKQLCEKHPDSEKAPESMLKTGYAYQQMGKKQDALNYFRKTFITYPFSQPGAVARSIIEKPD